MECLQHLLDGSTVPILTAFLLGLLTAVSPCPLATNIAAVGYISKDLGKPPPRFSQWLALHARTCRDLYVAGCGADCCAACGGECFRHSEGNRQMGRNADRSGADSDRIVYALRTSAQPAEFRVLGARRADGAGWRMGCAVARHSFFSGVLPDERRFLFRNAYSDVGRRNGGYLLPAVFAVATGLPVVIVAWLLAYSVAGLGAFYNRMQAIQKWLSRIVGLLFIAVGIYYGAIYFC